MNLTLTIVFERDEESIHAFIPEIPGVYSCGETIEEARRMVLDALREVIQSRNEVDPDNPDEVLSIGKIHFTQDFQAQAT